MGTSHTHTTLSVLPSPRCIGHYYDAAANRVLALLADFATTTATGTHSHIDCFGFLTG